MAFPNGGQYNEYPRNLYAMNAGYQGQYSNYPVTKPEINAFPLHKDSAPEARGYIHNPQHQYPSHGIRQPQTAFAVAVKASPPASKPINSEIASERSQPLSQPVPPLDYEVLLLSLAEEYFAAAYERGALADISRREEDLQKYYKLIATGLGCLEAVLKHFKLTPEREATVRLRYASVLHEETESSLEAEEAVNKGILIAEMHRLFDLKYNMQHLLARMLYQTNPRAAFKFLDGVIRDTEAYQHIGWVYAFRFLRMSFHYELSSHQDIVAAISQLRGIVSLANDYGDKSVLAIATVLEALMCLQEACDQESFEQAQRALACVRSLQIDPNFSELPQLSLLIAFVDLSCYLQHFDPAQAIQHMQTMQSCLARVGEEHSWTKDGSFAIKIPRARMSSCKSRSGIIREEEDGSLALMFNWIPKDDIHNVGYFLAGVAMAHRNTSDGQKSEQILRDGIRRGIHAQREASNTPKSIITAASQQKRREQITCYMRLQLALTLCARTSWSSAREQLSQLHLTFDSWSDVPTSLKTLCRYLSAVISQGTGDLPAALAAYQNCTLSTQATPKDTSPFMTDISVLASLNMLLIIRSPSHPLHHHHRTLLGPLTGVCLNHPNRQIQAAYHILTATLPDSSTNLLTKQSLQSALQTSKASDNSQLLCLVLGLMWWKFFRGLVGEQVNQSARASLAMARKSGNTLWMSVSAGALAETMDAAGRGEEAEVARSEAFLKAKELPEAIREIIFEIKEDHDVEMNDASRRTTDWG